MAEDINYRTLTQGRQIRRTNSSTKYQVFVSSTFTDLIKERQAVSRAILELNHIPAGMELFPAFDQSQLDFIKRVIDDCDYYLIIVGGRYGSLTPDGISFTEAEYNYAVEQEKPVIALINDKIDELPAKNVEKDQTLLEKLEKFKRELKDKRLVKLWSSIDDLKSNAIISLTAAFSNSPQVGWRRDRGETDEDALRRYAALRERLDREHSLRRQLQKKIVFYEDINTAEVAVDYLTNDNTASSTTISSSVLIREFAVLLKKGFTKQDAKERLSSYFRHRLDIEEVVIPDESVESVLLFFEVFDIAEVAPNNTFRILDNKMSFLKSAFRKPEQGTYGRGIEDDIPF